MMKRKLKLKPFVLPTAYLLILLGLISGMVMSKEELAQQKYTYVSGEIFDTTVPVMNESLKLLRPYTGDGVKEAQYYYDYTADQSRQENSIIYHEGTYMQNSGVDFTSDEVFDVLAVLDGTVMNVKEDELLGKIVEIRHNNDLVSVYQSLSEVTVKKNDTVKQGQAIGKSGTNELEAALKNHLHFELSNKGQIVDPSKYFDKEIEETKQEN